MTIHAGTSGSVQKKILISPVSGREGISDLELRAWSLPAGVLGRYSDAGIIKMFPWQRNCLRSAGVLGMYCSRRYTLSIYII